MNASTKMISSQCTYYLISQTEINRKKNGINPRTLVCRKVYNIYYIGLIVIHKNIILKWFIFYHDLFTGSLMKSFQFNINSFFVISYLLLRSQLVEFQKPFILSYYIINKYVHYNIIS